MAKYEYLGPPMCVNLRGHDTALAPGALIELDPGSPLAARLLARRMVRIVAPEVGCLSGGGTATGIGRAIRRT